MRRSLGEVRIWGVLGLLLALVLAVGYGQEVVPVQPPTQVAVLTVNHNCTVKVVSPTQKFELFVLDNDVHPTRNITYQNDPASVSPPFPRPDNPPGCPGIAYFFPGSPPDYYGGTIQLYITHNLLGYRVTPKLCFRKFPPPPPDSTNNPKLFITATASFPLPLWNASLTISTPSSCPPICPCVCVTGPALNNVPTNTQWVKWTFKIEDNSVEFCRLELWQ